jgi:hypothetical protein
VSNQALEAPKVFASVLTPKTLMRSLPALLPSPLGFYNLCRGVPDGAGWVGALARYKMSPSDWRTGENHLYFHETLSMLRKFGSPSSS